VVGAFIDALQPDDEQRQQEDDVGHRQHGQVEAGRQALKVSQREDGQRQRVADDADDNDERRDVERHVVDHRLERVGASGREVSFCPHAIAVVDA